MMRSQIFFGFGAVAVQAALTFASTPARADDIDDIVQADMQARHIPGLSLAIVKDGVVVKTSAYGLADIDKKTATFPDSLFEIGPLTRQITATAVMQLVEKGKIGLDDKVSKYLDSTPEDWSDITVRELLMQTSGIKDVDQIMMPGLRQAKGLTVDQTIALVAKLPLDFTAGAQWESSTTNYLVLGKIVEKASGQVYGEYISQNILQPQEMKSTHLANPKADFPGLAKGYKVDDAGKSSVVLPIAASTAWSAGSLVASAGDLAKWDVAVDGGKLLSAQTVEAMFKSGAPSGADGVDYAVGVTLRHPEGHNVAENGGSTGGFSSHYLRDVDDRVEMVILTNDADFNPMDLSHRILEYYVPSIAPDTMAEKDPDVDDYCKGILQKLQDGKLDATEFSPEAWTAVRRQHLDAMSAVLTKLGPLSTFVQTDKDVAADGQPIYTYRCIFGDTAYILTAGPSTDGKIGHFQFAVDPFDAE